MYALAVNRGGRWTYRPRDTFTLRGDELGARDRRSRGTRTPAELFGQELEEIP
jgi:hypothetical protein